MIYCLTGKIIKKTLDSVVISCGGVGYFVQIPATTGEALPPVGKEGTVYTIMNVTENDVSLYGFATEEQRDCFKMLTAVTGVGPKAGLAILSIMTPEKIALAASSGDHKAFTKAAGVGPKLAQRITLELKELPCAVIGHAAFRIAVSDTGYGMAPEFVEHIFEPFTRFENSTTNKIQGTGLGMAITKSIVDMNGGSIRIQSELGKGSRFEVDLTFEIDKEAKPETEIKSVLLITREEQLIRNVKAAFKESDMELSAAASVEQAQTLLEEHPVQAIVLNGFTKKETLSDAVRRLREKTAEGTLIFCCDYTQSDALRDTLAECGVNGKIPRPFFMVNFVRAVNQAKGETKQNTAETDNSLRGMRFLCAEDNALNAEILEAIMDMQGASCVVYPNGAELVKAFADVKPDEFDAILMDVQMPVMNGLDATRAVRASDNPLGRTIPIIAMTANAFSSDVQACLNAGMDAHVSKPLDISVLERTLKIVAAAKFSGGGSGDKARSLNSH